MLRTMNWDRCMPQWQIRRETQPFLGESLVRQNRNPMRDRDVGDGTLERLSFLELLCPEEMTGGQLH